MECESKFRSIELTMSSILTGALQVTIEQETP